MRSARFSMVSGGGWPLARDLGTSDRMVRRWEAGDFAVADGIPHDEEHAPARGRAPAPAQTRSPAVRSPWTLRNEPAPYRNAVQRRDALVMILALATVAAVLILA